MLTYNVEEVNVVEYVIMLLFLPLSLPSLSLSLSLSSSQSFSLWERLLLLSVYPLTGSIYVPSCPVLAILTPTLTQGRPHELVSNSCSTL